jgi:hypothetical protein
MRLIRRQCDPSLCRPRNIAATVKFPLIGAHVEEAVMLFWPIVIALGPGFAALYYDHDVKAFSDQATCEQTLPDLERKAKATKDFMDAVTDAAGDKSADVVFQLACIDKTPQEFQHELHSLQGQGDDGADI